jgi:hypothetical protein
MVHIAQAFAAGDFYDAHTIHDQTPPEFGDEAACARIRYTAEDRAGGRFDSHDGPRGAGCDPRFLKFQITDHRTGDATSVQQ